ncbi:AAA family ATPase [Corynebacterium durum]|uniref:AAA family ATPase n=1 Tax=Corynebacterium durum TaxID=61592 RepID=UPI00288A0604|nr:ATP-binding protein [Corynebacterium durum]
MLLMFTCENYRSFKVAATLDVQQRSFTTMRPKDDDWEGATLRTAALFGPNASGKSNILRPFTLLQHAVDHSIKDDSAVRALRDPHRLKRDEATSFTSEFVTNGIRFQWYIKLGDNGIIEESLHASETNRWRKIFERSGTDISFGAHADISRAARENIAEYATLWSLTLSAWKVVKNPGRYFAAAAWWSNDIHYIHPNERQRHTRHASLVELTSKHKSWLKLGTAALTLADVGISSVSINEVEAPAHIKQFLTKLNSLLADEMSQLDEEDSEYLTEADLDYISQHLEFTHNSSDGTFTLDEDDESLGTMMWFDLLVPAVYRLVVGGLLVVDEIDSSLHPVLLRELILLFKDPATNKSGAQLIFTTHDVTLLGNDLTPTITPDEAWLVEKYDSYSELIPWDIYSIRKNHNVEKRYLQGAFGALPQPNRRRIESAIDTLAQEYIEFLENTEN